MGSLDLRDTCTAEDTLLFPPFLSRPHLLSFLHLSSVPSPSSHLCAPTSLGSGGPGQRLSYLGHIQGNHCKVVQVTHGAAQVRCCTGSGFGGLYLVTRMRGRVLTAAWGVLLSACAKPSCAETPDLTGYPVWGRAFPVPARQPHSTLWSLWTPAPSSPPSCQPCFALSPKSCCWTCWRGRGFLARGVLSAKCCSEGPAGGTGWGQRRRCSGREETVPLSGS